MKHMRIVFVLAVIWVWPLKIANAQTIQDTAWRPVDPVPPFMTCEYQNPPLRWEDFEGADFDSIEANAVLGQGGLFGDIKRSMFGQNMGESGFYGCAVGYCGVAGALSIAMGPAAIPGFVGGCTSAAVICAIRHF